MQRSPDGRVHNWWSDGVTLATLAPTEKWLFVAGVTFWADGESPFWLAPFEVEFYWSADQDGDFDRSILRFGQVDSDGNVIRSGPDSARMFAG